LKFTHPPFRIIGFVDKAQFIQFVVETICKANSNIENVEDPLLTCESVGIKSIRFGNKFRMLSVALHGMPVLHITAAN
jgi:hypothetical protein